MWGVFLTDLIFQLSKIPFLLQTTPEEEGLNDLAICEKMLFGGLTI